MTHIIELPAARKEIAAVRAGDSVLISGELYTARDAAHKRIIELLDDEKEPPFSIKDSAVYYTGPTPAPPGYICGSIGPTTSYRMDIYTPRLLSLGMRIMIGKGKRSSEVVESIKKNGALYLGAIGGAGALLASCVEAIEVIAFSDLGTEAVHKLRVKEFPTIALIDCFGGIL